MGNSRQVLEPPRTNEYFPNLYLLQILIPIPRSIKTSRKLKSRRRSSAESDEYLHPPPPLFLFISFLFDSLIVTNVIVVMMMHNSTVDHPVIFYDTCDNRSRAEFLKANSLKVRYLEIRCIFAHKVPKIIIK